MMTACSSADRPPTPGDARLVRPEVDSGALRGGPETPLGSDGLRPEATARSERYPSGPYAQDTPEPGSIIEDLQFRGFVNPTAEGPASSQTFATISLSDVRLSGPRFALIHTVALWCGSCKAAAKDVAARGRDVIEAGGIFLEILVDGQNLDIPPTEDELRSWADAFDLTVTTVGGADERTTEVFSDRDYAYIIDLWSMRVLWQAQQLYADPTNAAVAIDKILTDYL